MIDMTTDRVTVQEVVSKVTVISSQLNNARVLVQTRSAASVEVSQREVVLEQGRGSQGPPGPQGPPGSGGGGSGSFYEYTQTSAAATWPITHNFGRRVNLSLFDDAGKEVFTTTEQHPPYNTVTAIYSQPRTGSAVVS